MVISDESLPRAEGNHKIWVQWMGPGEIDKELRDTRGLDLEHHNPQTLRTIDCLALLEKHGIGKNYIKVL